MPVLNPNDFLESVLPEQIALLPFAAFDGPVQVIDREGPELEQAVAFLRRQTLLGFDTETRPCFQPRQRHNKTALLQLSTDRQAFLFRLNTLSLPHSLTRILANPAILKVGAAVRDDVRGLQRLRPFQGAGFVDLQSVGEEWGIRDKSVKKMSAIVLGVRISKAQQLSNWEAPALSEAQIRYAATDAWVCREMYCRLLETEKKPLSPVSETASAAASAPVSASASTPASASVSVTVASLPASAGLSSL